MATARSPHKSQPAFPTALLQYASAAERNGFRVVRIHTEPKAWDFESRDAFFGFCAVGLLRGVRPGEENTFRFYQMDVTLTAA